MTLICRSFDHSNKSKAAQLDGDVAWFGEGGDAVGGWINGVSGVVNVAGDVEYSTGDDIAKENELTVVAILDLHATETVSSWEISRDGGGHGVDCGGHGSFGGGVRGVGRHGYGSYGPGHGPWNS